MNSENPMRYELLTARLRLCPATAPACRAAAGPDRTRLSQQLDADIAADWPPDLLQDALEPTAKNLEAGIYVPPWSMYWMILKSPARAIGTCGFYSAPKDGVVGLGYSVVASEQRKGLATEATRALVEFAFGDDRTRVVVGETLAHLTASIRVMQKLGFRRVAESATGINGDENVVRFELPRGEWLRLRGS